MSDSQSLVDFKLSQVHLDIQKVARDFAQKYVKPAEIAIDKISDPSEAFASPEFKNVMKKYYEAGFHKTGLPEAVGGTGLNFLGQLIVLEELATAGPGLASHFLILPIGYGQLGMLQGLHPLYKQKWDEYLADTEGIHHGCWAITEPHLGTDSMSMEPGLKMNTTIMPVEGSDDYVINGAKAGFVSNGGLADMILLFASMDQSKTVAEGMGIALIPGDLKGITRGKPMDKLGLRALNQAEIFFDNVRIPKEFILMKPSAGAAGLLGGGGGNESVMLVAGNASIATLALGTARASYEAALAYAKSRKQGGKTIFEHQIVAMKLFKAFRAIEASRALIWKAADAFKMQMSVAARTLTCDLAVEITMEMVQVFGGYGISKEYPVEKYYRDAKLLQIMDGTVEAMALGAAATL